MRAWPGRAPLTRWARVITSEALIRRVGEAGSSVERPTSRTNCQLSSDTINRTGRRSSRIALAEHTTATGRAVATVATRSATVSSARRPPPTSPAAPSPITLNRTRLDTARLRSWLTAALAMSVEARTRRWPAMAVTNAGAAIQSWSKSTCRASRVSMTAPRRVRPTHEMSFQRTMMVSPGLVMLTPSVPTDAVAQFDHAARPHSMAPHSHRGAKTSPAGRPSTPAVTLNNSTAAFSPARAVVMWRSAGRASTTGWFTDRQAARPARSRRLPRRSFPTRPA